MSDQVLYIDTEEPCGEGMCQCSCGQGCVCGCECPGDPDAREPDECDNCYGGDNCACANGLGARFDECACGPTEEGAVRVAQELAANASDDAPVDVEDLDYDDEPSEVAQ